MTKNKANIFGARAQDYWETSAFPLQKDNLDQIAMRAVKNWHGQWRMWEKRYMPVERYHLMKAQSKDKQLKFTDETHVLPTDDGAPQIYVLVLIDLGQTCKTQQDAIEMLRDWERGMDNSGERAMAKTGFLRRHNVMPNERHYSKAQSPAAVYWETVEFPMYDNVEEHTALRIVPARNGQWQLKHCSYVPERAYTASMNNPNSKKSGIRYTGQTRNLKTEQGRLKPYMLVETDMSQTFDSLAAALVPLRAFEEEMNARTFQGQPDFIKRHDIQFHDRHFSKAPLPQSATPKHRQVHK